MSLEKKIRTKAPRQRALGKSLGGAKIMFHRSRFPLSIVNFVLILITAYYTTVRHIVPWLPLWIFLIILVVCIGGYMVIDYVYFYPSELEFKKEEQYKRDPIACDVREINDRLERIENELGIEDEDKRDREEQYEG